MWNGLSTIKIYNNHIIQNFLNKKICIFEIFQYTTLLNFSFDDVLFIYLYFDIFFESTFFVFFVWHTYCYHFKNPLRA
jgi:hypothetical protein